MLHRFGMSDAPAPKRSFLQKALLFFKSVKGRLFLGSFWLVLIFVPFMSKIGEWYPFSHFPMYSRLDDIWTLVLTDENGSEISTQNSFEPRPNAIRKLTTSRLRDVRKEAGKRMSEISPGGPEWKEAVNRTLTWLIANHKPKENLNRVKELQVWHVDYVVENNRAFKKRTLLHSVPMPAPATASP
jgi:hypothetical protein